MTKGYRIKLLREKIGISQTELAQKIGVSKQTLYKYENDIITNIPSNKIELIAYVTNSSPEYIMGWSDEQSDYTKYGLLKPAVRTLPVLGHVACGEPVFANEEVEYVTLKDAPREADYILVAKGDSMVNARIRDGDYVFIKRQDTVNNGDIGVVVIEDEATLKRVYYDTDSNTMTLLAENPAYAPLVYNGSALADVRILGKAIAFQSDVR